MPAEKMFFRQILYEFCYDVESVDRLQRFDETEDVVERFVGKDEKLQEKFKKRPEVDASTFVGSFWNPGIVELHKYNTIQSLHLLMQ